MRTGSRLEHLIDMVAHAQGGNAEDSLTGKGSGLSSACESLGFEIERKERQPHKPTRGVEELENELELIRAKSKLLAQEVDLFRQRRVVFWSDRFRNSFDAWNMMNPGFQQLKDDSAVFHGSLKGYRLQPSLSLLRVAYLTYRVKLNRANLKAVLLAPVVDIPLDSGELALRIFSEPDTFICSSIAPVADIKDDAPTLFEFPAIKNSDEVTLNFTIHVQGVDAPVRLFELRRYAFAGFGKLGRKPFAGYLFD